VCNAEEGPVVGPDQFKQKVYFPLVTAFPDLQIFLDDFLEVNDQVVVRWRAEATHTGNGLGIRPTGRAVELVGITWVRLSNGKLVEGWQSSNIPIVVRELDPDA
jgi:predicted ester cyclase